MKKTYRLAGLIMASVMFLSSCTPIGKAQQNGWIKKLGEAFPEDTFTYEGHPRNLGLEYSIVLVKSELFPDDEIRLWKENGNLCTNYHYIAYKKDIYEELHRVLDGRFPCSSCVIMGADEPSNGFPVEATDAEKYIKDYMNYRCRVLLFYEDESQIPDDDEIKEIIYDLIADEKHVYTLYLYYIDAQYADDKYEGVRYSKLTDTSILDKYKVRFRLSMKDTDHISRIDVEYNDGSDNDHTIVRDIDV